MAKEYVLKQRSAESHSQIDYKKELNEQQYQAVTAPPGPALILAGAGSGKTRTLTYRVAYLLDQGLRPDQILLLTFTNKAAKEMLERVSALVETTVQGLWGGTFHSVGSRMLRRHADRMGYGKDYTILDRDDSVQLIKTIAGESKSKAVKEKKFPKADKILEMISLAANIRLPLRELLEQKYYHQLAYLEEILWIDKHYQSRKQASNAMDFDDLLSLWLELLLKHPDILERYQEQFHFILVDEFQDTNSIQAEIVQKLAARHNNVMAVGDDAQSIYSWRGADVENILSFTQRFPGAKVYPVEINYRSAPEILEVANAAIAHNPQVYPKKLSAIRPECGARPALVACENAYQQADFILQRIEELVEQESVPLKEVAILYRSHFHASELQMTLQKSGVPFDISSGVRFFDQAHIKDVLAYLKLIVNPRDEISFRRLALMLPGLGLRSASKLWGIWTGIYEAHAEESQNLLASRLWKKTAEHAPAKARSAMEIVGRRLSEMEVEPYRNRPGALIRLILERGYEAHVEEQYNNASSRLEDLEQMAQFAESFPTLEEFLSDLALLTEIEREHADLDESNGMQRDAIKLMTIHQAKGLEFQAVFVIGLCDGQFPSSRSLNEPGGEREERRLFYVAVTRAKDWLALCYPIMKTRSGYYSDDPFSPPSRFLQEIPEELLEPWKLTGLDPFGW